MSPEDEGAAWDRYRQQLQESRNRKANYNKLRGFCGGTAGRAKTNLEEFYDSLEELYKKHVVEFENTDDDYRKKGAQVYDACTSAEERRWDFAVKTAKFLNDINEGANAAVIDFVSGILGLAVMLAKIDLALRVAVVTVPFGTTPQWVKDTGKEAIEGVFGIAQILKNPGRTLAALGQKATDAVEEKGIPYVVSYTVTDLAIGRLVDMGIGKLRGLGKADDLGDAAKVLDKIDDVEKVADDLGDAAKVVDKINDVEKVVDDLKDIAKVADDIEDVTKAVDKAGDVAKIKILSSEEAEELAFNAIKGPDKADSIVLGRYETLKDKFGNDILDAAGNKIPTENSYNVIAKNVDAQYFELNNWDELAGVYSDDEIWKINEKFLDIQTSSGREIYLSHNPEDFLNTSNFYSKELNYLLDNGYKFVEEGGVMACH